MHNLSGTDIATISSASSRAAMPRLSAVSNACNISQQHADYTNLIHKPKCMLLRWQRFIGIFSISPPISCCIATNGYTSHHVLILYNAGHHYHHNKQHDSQFPSGKYSVWCKHIKLQSLSAVPHLYKLYHITLHFPIAHAESQVSLNAWYTHYSFLFFHHDSCWLLCYMLNALQTYKQISHIQWAIYLR